MVEAEAREGEKGSGPFSVQMKTSRSPPRGAAFTEPLFVTLVVMVTKSSPRPTL